MTRTPFLYLVISFSTGLVCGYFTNRLLFAIPLLLLLLLIFIAVLLLSETRPDYKDIVCIVLISCFGFFYYEGRTRIFPEDHIRYLTHIKGDLSILGDVISIPDKREDRTFFRFEVRSVMNSTDTIPVCGKVRVTLEDDVEYGNRLILYGTLNFPPSSRNPGGFDYGRWLNRQDIYVLMSPDSLVRIEGKYGENLIIIAARIRIYIEKVIDNYVGGKQGAFLKGIIIGERGGIPGDVQEVFRNTGVVHVLAVSGLHVGIIAFLLTLIIRLFRAPNIINIIITSTLLIIYALMIDLRPSVVRATIMCILLMISFLTRRDTDTMNTLSVAAFIILLWNPQSLFDVSFQLSFGATAGIIYLYPKIYEIARVRGNKFIDNIVIKPFTISLSAQAGTTLLAAHYFYRLPIISLVANLLVIPLTGICIVTGLLLSFVNLLGIGILNKIFASSVYGFTTLTLNVVNMFGRVPNGHFWIGSPSPLFLILYFIILISGFNAIHNFIKWGFFGVSFRVLVYTIFISLAVILTTGLYRVYNPEIRLTFLDVGQGNSTLIEMGETVLIDGGSYHRGVPTAAELLRNKGIREISLIFLTSPLSYDIGGLSYILENFKVGCVALPFIPYDSYGYKKFLRNIKDKKIPFRFVKEGDKIAAFSVMNPKGGVESSTKIKDASLVLNFNAKEINQVMEDIKTLFLGHVENNIHEMVEESDILKAPYFGGYRNPSFLEIVKPEVTVISVGSNRWGLPSEEMIEEYERYGRVIRTDRQGACVVRIGKDGMTIHTMSEEESPRDRVLRWTGVR